MSTYAASLPDAFGLISDGWMNLLTLVGLVGTFFGLWLTWKQANQAKEKAEKAESAANSLKQAVEVATQRIARQDLIASLAQTRQLVDQLATAEKSKSSEFAQQTLVQLVQHLSQVQALMGQDATNLLPESVAHQLKDIQESALNAKDALARDTYGKIPTHVESLKKSLDMLGADFMRYETSAKYEFKD